MVPHRHLSPLLLALGLAAAAPAQEPAAPPPPPEPTLEEKVDRAISRGVAHLLGEQYPDGSWLSSEDQDYLGGPTALVVYSLVKAGLPVEHGAVQRGLDFLALHPPTKTYDAALRILLLCAVDPQRYAERIEVAADVMFDHHPGMFTYQRVMRHTPGGDLSNTQFAIVALEALDRNGWTRDDKFWEKQAEFLADMQKEDGGFPYHPGGNTTQTMTIAGFGCLAACERVLERRGARDRDLAPIRAAMQRAEEWLDANWLGSTDWTGENGLNRWGFYAWYGMERGAALADQDEVGGHDWYEDAAKVLVAKQGGDGRWTDPWGRPTLNTPFSLLTLSKATAKVGTGGEPRQGLWEMRWSNADAGRNDLLITATGAPQCGIFLAGLHPEVRELYTFAEEKQPRLVRFSWLLDGEEIAVHRPEDPVADAQEAALPRFPMQLQLSENRSYVLEATAWLQIPGTESLDDVVQVGSGPLTLAVQGLVGAEQREQLAYARRALDVDTEELEQMTASSEQGGNGNAARRAFDRVEATRWLATREDPEPWIRVVPKKSIRVAGVRLLPALSGPDRFGFDLPTQVVVKVNGRENHLSLDPKDAVTGTLFEFNRPVRLRELEVRILAKRKARNSNEAGMVGFREIQLLGPER